MYKIKENFIFACNERMLITDPFVWTRIFSLELLGDTAQVSHNSVNNSGRYGYTLFTQVSEVCLLWYDSLRNSNCSFDLCL